MQLCEKCRDLVKIFIFRSGVVFTPEVIMKHVDRHWKAYPVGNKGKSPESKHGVASANDGHYYQMDKSGKLHAQR